MQRDLRDTPLYREVEEQYRRMLEPAFGRVSGATDPDPSPDGRQIAFTGAKLERLEGEPVTTICVADVGSGTLEEVTAGPNNDRLPRWSPDGARLAFLSDRRKKGESQLYLLERGRVGEAMPAPAVKGSIEYLSWSPDGASILLGVAETGAELAGVQGSGSTPEADTELPPWVPTVERSADQEGWRRAWVYEVATGEVRAVSREGLNVWESAWCGADRLAAIVSDGPGEETWYEARLVLIDLASGKEEELHRPTQQMGLPTAAPSGRRLAIVEAICSDRLVVAGDVRVFDPATGASTRVDSRDVDVTHVAWTGEDRLLFIGIRGLQTVAGRFDAITDEATVLWSTDDTCGYIYPDLRPLDGDAFVTVLSGYERYAEIVVVRDGTARTAVSLKHDGATHTREIGGRVEPLRWTALDGLEIEGLLAVPPGHGPHPLVVLVHGGPISATLNRWTVRGPSIPILVSRGFAVFFPNPRGSTGRGQEFASMVYGDMGGADAQDILSGIDALVERGVADGERVGVTGGSYGGFMAAWLVTQTDRFAASVAISPVTDWYSQHHTSNIGHWDRLILQDEPTNPDGEYFRRSPVMFAGRARTPTLLTAGYEDRCTPPGQAEEFYRALVEAGTESELVRYPGEGHGVRKLPAAIDLTTRVVDWFERHLRMERSAV